MNGHEPFPELSSYDQEELISEKFVAGCFADLGCALINRVAHQCWAGVYESADEVLWDLKNGG